MATKRKNMLPWDDYGYVKNGWFNNQRTRLSVDELRRPISICIKTNKVCLEQTEELQRNMPVDNSPLIGEEILEKLQSNN